jgi:hypothetical protein
MPRRQRPEIRLPRTQETRRRQALVKKARSGGLISRISKKCRIARLRGGCDRDRTSFNPLKYLTPVLTKSPIGHQNPPK